MAQNQQNDDQEFQAEYRIIKRDVLKVIITNGLIILLLVGLFVLNRKIDLLDKFARFF